MIERLAERIVEGQIRQGTLGESDKDLYIYSYILFISQIVNLLATFLIAAYFKDFRSVLLFLVLFIPLRTYAGGIHAKSPETCALVSGLILCMVCIVNKIYPVTEVRTVAVLTVEVMSVMMVWLLVPVEDSNKPLDDVERPRYRKRAHLVLCVEVLFFMISYFIRMRWIIFNITLCHFLIMLSVLAGALRLRYERRV